MLADVYQQTFSHLRYLKARFEPLRTSPVMIALSGSFEHRYWPIHDDEALEKYVETEFMVLAEHYSPLS